MGLKPETPTLQHEDLFFHTIAIEMMLDMHSTNGTISKTAVGVASRLIGATNAAFKGNNPKIGEGHFLNEVVLILVTSKHHRSVRWRKAAVQGRVILAPCLVDEADKQENGETKANHGQQICR